MLKHLDLWWCTAWGQRRRAANNGFLLKMFKNLFDDRWVFYAGDNLDWALAFFTDFDIDIEHTF